MRVLVTGAQGLVARALLRSAPADIQTIPAAREDLDITNAAALGRFIDDSRPDLIVNTAAYTAVDQAENEPEAARQVNEFGAREVAMAARRHGIRLIHISTNFVFDGLADQPYSHAAQTAPVNVYGRTKLAGEDAVVSTLADSAIILRTAWVYGASGSNFLLTMLSLMRERRPIRVVADQFGTPTAAASVAEAIWAFARLPAASGIYHWTNAGEASWYEFATAIAEDAAALGLIPFPPDLAPAATADFPELAPRPRYAVLDLSSTIDTVGLSPENWRSRLAAELREPSYA